MRWTRRLRLRLRSLLRTYNGFFSEVGSHLEKRMSLRIDSRWRDWCPLAVVAALFAIASASAEAQLASRPVDEWRRLLDAPERIATLKSRRGDRSTEAEASRHRR